MTTAGHIRAIASSNTPEVTIAGVPWPLYKVVALLTGFVAALAVGIVTMTAGPAVLAGAAVTTLVWLALGTAQHSRHYRSS
ncbi:MAG: hypothetical protein WAM92_12495 [Mycobacterium sp.]